MSKELGVFHTHYNHIVQENPSGVPEEEYIVLASDRFKEVEGRKFKFQKVFPILQDVVKYSSGSRDVEDEEEPSLGFLDHYQPSVANTVDSSREDGSVATLATPRDVVVTPVNPGRVNMAGSVMGSHMRQPMGSKRAKALAATTRGCEEAQIAVVVPPPPPSAAVVVADKMTVTLGHIYRNGHKEDQFDIRYKCWKALVHHQEEVEARSMMQEMMSYREPLQEEQQQEEVEDDDDGKDDGGVEGLFDEEEEVEVVDVAPPAGEGSASPDSIARHRPQQPAPPGGGAPEEKEDLEEGAS